MRSTEFSQMLKGSELLAFVKANPELGKTELARQAGYTRMSEEGKEQILLQTFYDAAMEAHGTPIKSAGGFRGKASKNSTTVHKSGILLIGSSHVKQFGADPGDIFGIELKEDGIWLPLKQRDVDVLKVAGTPAQQAPAVAAQDPVEDEEDAFDEEDEDLEDDD